MHQNPYQPPADLSITEAGQTELLPEGRPIYSGPTVTIEGRVDSEQALALARQCQVVPFVKPQAVFHRLFSVLVIMGTLFFIGVVLAADFSFFALGCVFVFGLVLWFLGARLRKEPMLYDDADPPLGGSVRLHLHREGFSIEKQTRDSRPIEVYSGWQQVQISLSDQAWLWNIGTINPFLIVKDWVTDPDVLAAIDQLCMDISFWNHRTRSQGIRQTYSVPEPVRPDWKRFAESFRVSSLTEPASRRRAKQRVGQRLPKFQCSANVSGQIWRWGWLFGFLICLFGGLAVAINWGQAGGGPRWSISVIIIAIGLTVTTLVPKLWARHEYHVEAGLSETDLWYDYHVIVLRISLVGLPFRQRDDDQLILATDDGSTTIVIDRNQFADATAFDRLSQSMVAQSTG